jgi:hypothetical protein
MGAVLSDLHAQRRVRYNLCRVCSARIDGIVV